MLRNLSFDGVAVVLASCRLHSAVLFRILNDNTLTVNSKELARGVIERANWNFRSQAF